MIGGLYNSNIPVATFIGVTLWLADTFGFFTLLFNYIKTDLLIGVTALGFFAWLFGILLLVLNRGFIRLLEGYGHYNPFRLLIKLEKRRYQKLIDEKKRLDTLSKEYGKRNEVLPLERKWKRESVTINLVTQFPDPKDFVMPTRFGNTIRSFETYSRVMYGLDAIPGWMHLQAVIPIFPLTAL